MIIFVQILLLKVQKIYNMKALKLWFLAKFAPRTYRYIIYQWMFEYLSTKVNTYDSGFCLLLYSWRLEHGTVNIRSIIALPELFAYKPQQLNKDDYWFSNDAAGQQIRLQILKEIILAK